MMMAAADAPSCRPEGRRPERLPRDVAARYPGKAGTGRVTFTFQLGPDSLAHDLDGSVSSHCSKSVTANLYS
ncbi:hypothetical protein FHS79_003050 [Polymorphobacter multimanifer]|uniref:Uncharacterized protein n=1 Tax=Polymorphobacter multimanifer TaxID=1070431 RepID=A0A841L8A0_9SPHN|nr:hypothetical protein [Polymorphobacter multimanifer]